MTDTESLEGLHPRATSPVPRSNTSCAPQQHGNIAHFPLTTHIVCGAFECGKIEKSSALATRTENGKWSRVGAIPVQPCEKPACLAI